MNKNIKKIYKYLKIYQRKTFFTISIPKVVHDMCSIHGHSLLIGCLYVYVCLHVYM